MRKLELETTAVSVRSVPSNLKILCLSPDMNIGFCMARHQVLERVVLSTLGQPPRNKLSDSRCLYLDMKNKTSESGTF
jgi:hypothetical protein